MTPSSGRASAISDSDERPRRIAALLGAGGRPRAATALTAAVVLIALLAIVIGVRQPAHLPTGDRFGLFERVGLVALLAFAAQLGRLRFRLGRAAVNISWAEAAVILGLQFAPAGWLPFATFVGAAVAWLLLNVFSDDQPLVDVVHSAASLTVGVSAAAVVATLVAGPAVQPGAGPLSPLAGLGLFLGCCAYFVVTTALTVLTLALLGDAPPGLTLVRGVHGKLPMFVGNVIVGLAALLVVEREPAWLTIFVPALWLLQRTYGFHLRAEDERRIWQAFARASRTLGGFSERDVAAAGVRGALDVFGAQRVEVEVAQPDGRRHRYAADGDSDGEVAELTPAVPAPRPGGPPVVRSMAVGGAEIGELSVWLSQRSTPASRDELAVSVYGDALGGALHDAATHQRLAALSARSSHQAVHDPLTGLANRAALLAAGDELLRTLDSGHQVALLLLDINDFKEVNGTLGHGAGDELLRVVGARLSELSREDELLARLGDDEFALLVPRLPTLSDSAHPGLEPAGGVPQAVRRARELVAELSIPTDVAGVRLLTEVAVGVVVAAAGRTDLVELIRRAEIAMDQAKELRVSVATYDSDRDAANTDHLAMLAELREAIDNDDQLVVDLQPAVDLGSGAPTGVEALARWRHPRRGLLPPAEFIRTVEHSELLAPFTRYVLDRSLTVAAEWAAAGIDLPVSVNISARSLLDTSFPGQVAETLRRRRVPAHRLVLEITETVAVSEEGVVDDVIAALRDLGVQLSVDDFGTGYSSLAFLARVPVDELKVDRSFVGRMIDSAEAATIVRSAVELGRGLNLRVVAEGVETADQRAALLALGCTAAQGYHFCKPLPADKIVSVLRSLGEAAPARILPLRADGAS